MFKCIYCRLNTTLAFMKTIITNTLTYFSLIILITSCTKEDVSQLSATEGIKSSLETTDSNSTNNNYNKLTRDKISLLLEKDEKDISKEILKHINAYRNSLGLKSLINNRTAKAQALSHSEYQANQENMSHNNSSSRAASIFRLENASFYGENVAFGYTNTKKLVEAWINSESHRVNIEGDFTHSGIGTIVNEQGVLYFTHVFFK